MEKILRVENIEKYYGGRGNITKAINGITFDVYEGEYVGIMGASGSGKTTLLNCIATIDKVTGGNIFVKDKNLTEMKGKDLSRFRREELGFIFQDFNLLDTLTAYENIVLSLAINKIPSCLIDEKITHIAKKLEIDGILDKFPYEISGGEKQRVASARAIIGDPTLILADEPTGSLDSKSARMLLDSLNVLNEKMSATILMVTHDSFTASYCKRILFIKDGKIFNELVRGNDSRKEFFNRIIDVVSLLGGDPSSVI